MVSNLVIAQSVDYTTIYESPENETSVSKVHNLYEEGFLIQYQDEDEIPNIAKINDEDDAIEWLLPLVNPEYLYGQVSPWLSNNALYLANWDFTLDSTDCFIDTNFVILSKYDYNGSIQFIKTIKKHPDYQLYPKALSAKNSNSLVVVCEKNFTSFDNPYSIRFLTVTNQGDLLNEHEFSPSANQRFYNLKFTPNNQWLLTTKTNFGQHKFYLFDEDFNLLAQHYFPNATIANLKIFPMQNKFVAVSLLAEETVLDDNPSIYSQKMLWIGNFDYELNIISEKGIIAEGIHTRFSALHDSQIYNENLVIGCTKTISGPPYQRFYETYHLDTEGNIIWQENIDWEYRNGKFSQNTEGDLISFDVKPNTSDVRKTTFCQNQPFYYDNNGDGNGNPNNIIYGCHPPEGYVTEGTDIWDNWPAGYTSLNEIDHQLWDITKTSLGWDVKALNGDKTSLYLYNSIGQLVKTSLNGSLTTNNLSAGIYVIKVLTSSNKANFKIAVGF